VTFQNIRTTLRKNILLFFGFFENSALLRPENRVLLYRIKWNMFPVSQHSEIQMFLSNVCKNLEIFSEEHSKCLMDERNQFRAEIGDAIWRMVWSPSKEIMNVFFEIAEKVDGRTKTWHPLERS